MADEPQTPAPPPSLAGDVARMREQIDFLAEQICGLVENDTKLARVNTALIDRVERLQKVNGLLVGSCRQMQAQIEGLALLGRIGRKTTPELETKLPPLAIGLTPAQVSPYSLGGTPTAPGA